MWAPYTSGIRGLSCTCEAEKTSGDLHLSWELKLWPDSYYIWWLTPLQEMMEILIQSQKGKSLIKSDRSNARGLDGRLVSIWYTLYFLISSHIKKIKYNMEQAEINLVPAGNNKGHGSLTNHYGQDTLHYWRIFEKNLSFDFWFFLQDSNIKAYWSMGCGHGPYGFALMPKWSVRPCLWWLYSYKVGFKICVCVCPE